MPVPPVPTDTETCALATPENPTATTQEINSKRINFNIIPPSRLIAEVRVWFSKNFFFLLIILTKHSQKHITDLSLNITNYYNKSLQQVHAGTALKDTSSNRRIPPDPSYDPGQYAHARLFCQELFRDMHA